MLNEASLAALNDLWSSVPVTNIIVKFLYARKIYTIGQCCLLHCIKYENCHCCSDHRRITILFCCKAPRSIRWKGDLNLFLRIVCARQGKMCCILAIYRSAHIECALVCGGWEDLCPFFIASILESFLICRGCIRPSKRLYGKYLLNLLTTSAGNWRV